MFVDIIKMVLEFGVCLERRNVNFKELLIGYDILDYLWEIIVIYMCLYEIIKIIY